MFGEGQGVVKSTSQPNSLSIRSYYSQLTMSIFSPLLIRNWGVGGKKKKRKKRGKEKEKKKGPQQPHETVIHSDVQSPTPH